MREPQITNGFVFDGIRIAVAADERAWDGGMRDRLACLPTCDDSQAELRFEFRPLRSAGRDLLSPPPGDKRTIYDCGHARLVYASQSDQLYYSHGDQLKMLCDPGAGRVRFSTLGVPEESTDLSLLITLAFVETLKRRGRFSVHAAGLGIDGRSIQMERSGETDRHDL